jgi:hypothetical protein
MLTGVQFKAQFTSSKPSSPRRSPFTDGQRRLPDVVALINERGHMTPTEVGFKFHMTPKIAGNLLKRFVHGWLCDDEDNRGLRKPYRTFQTH